MADLLDPTAVINVIIFIVPGYVIQRTVSLTLGLDFAKYPDMIIRSIFLSALNYMFIGPILFHYFSRHSVLESVSKTAFFGFLVLIVIPIGLALAYILVVLRFGVIRWFFERVLRMPYNDPVPSAWEEAFRSGEFNYVRIMLKSGTRLGGFWGRRSLAPSFPHSKDLFVEQACYLDDDGNVGQPIDGNRGLYVASSEISFIEFLRGGPNSDESK